MLLRPTSTSTRTSMSAATILADYAYVYRLLLQPGSVGQMSHRVWVGHGSGLETRGHVDRHYVAGAFFVKNTIGTKFLSQGHVVERCAPDKFSVYRVMGHRVTWVMGQLFSASYGSVREHPQAWARGTSAPIPWKS